MPGNTIDTVDRMANFSSAHQDAAVKLDGFLKVKKRSRRRKSPTEYTLSQVNRDTAKILEELLVMHLAMKNNSKSPIGQDYQRVEEVDVVEEDCSEKQPNGTSLSPLDVEMDSFPYADDAPQQQIRSKSLPADAKRSVIHHQGNSEKNILVDTDISPKSKSHSHNGGTTLPTGLPPNKKSISSPSVSSHACTPQPDLLDLHRYLDKGQISHSTTPSPLDGYSHSDSSSSGSSKLSEGRKKKSVFKRAKERLLHALRKQNEKNRKFNQNEKKDKSENKKSKKSKKSSSDHSTSAEILEETHTHRRTHIKQSHRNDFNDHTMLRTEETVETTDISGPAKSPKKHIRKTKKVKESTSGSFTNDGITGTLKRLTSFRRGSKKKLDDPVDIPDSGRKSIDQTVSIHGGCGDRKHYLRNYEEREDSPSSNRKKSHYTQVITDIQPDSIERSSPALPAPPAGGVGPPGPPPRPAGHRDISPPAQKPPPPLPPQQIGGGNRDSLHLEGISIGAEIDPSIRKARGSFELDYECDLLEHKVRGSDGHVFRHIDVDERKHIVLPDDVEIDGLDDVDHKRPQTASAINQQDDHPNRPGEDVIGEVAGRLGEIGDQLSLIAQLQSQTSRTEASSASPVISPVGAVGGGDNEANDLTPSEIELRNYLRSFGDNMTEKYALSENAEKAAMEIVKKATYNKFKESVRSTIGDDVGWDQLAVLFYVTKKAVNLAGAGGAVAIQVKEMSLRYIEDKFAGWIVREGGWEGMLGSDSGDSDYGVD